MPDATLHRFDLAALHTALDARRVERGLSWPQVAVQMHEQSAQLNERKPGHPISPATVRGVGANPRAGCQHVLCMLRWLGQAPEDFLAGAGSSDQRFALPAAGPDRILRWNLKLLYAALDEQRREQALTWSALSEIIGCAPGQLTGLRTARYATTIDLAMRIVQWLGRPSADFVHATRS